ncbi:EpsG-like putative glucosyltransferase [Halospina denitrificans]|uniref:EpsG-like putative glucosyltransferase n=1 Tax=Halospina denitrificans TaxID=332522 RepID=A0A4V3EQU8_9GAMM|nr:EpsG family protein [Halospina denitrificans]TDT43468.1 EpsG-like putative glucosyltransferase [Halospina denitrificans]
MAYAFHALIAFLASYVWESQRFDRKASSVSLFLLFVILLILPALQLEVGADYSSYLETAKGNHNISIYYQKGEYLYYTIFSIVKENLPAHSFFVIAYLINTALIVNALIKLKAQGYSAYIIVFLFLTTFGLYQNQMNIIRTYTAVFCFINAALCRSEDKNLKAIVFSLIGIISHQTYIFAIILLILPKKLLHILQQYPLRFYLFSFVATAFLATPYILGPLINSLFPFYNHYLSKEIFEPADIINIATKAYYIPLNLIFLYLLQKEPSPVPKNQRYFVGLWILTSGIYLGLLTAPVIFFRAWHYIAFFHLLPIYYILTDKRTRQLAPFVVIYVIAPFLIKVIGFPVGEYHYKTILGPICTFPWGEPQC